MLDGSELGCGGGIVAGGGGGGGQPELESAVRERRRKEDRAGEDLRCLMVSDGLGSG